MEDSSMPTLTTPAPNRSPRTTSVPQLLSQRQAWEYVGISRAMWFRLRSRDALPSPVAVPGSRVRFRLADLDAWIAALPAG